MLWGTQGLPDGNNIINGVESNSLAHNLAYVTRTEDYLKGQGWGHPICWKIILILGM